MYLDSQLICVAANSWAISLLVILLVLQSLINFLTSSLFNTLSFKYVTAYLSRFLSMKSSAFSLCSILCLKTGVHCRSSNSRRNTYKNHYLERSSALGTTSNPPETALKLSAKIIYMLKRNTTSPMVDSSEPKEATLFHKL